MVLILTEVFSSAAVVVAFFICWAPFHAQRLLYVMFYRYEWKFVSEGTYQVREVG